jgi:PAS domain S-box-containing protein
MLFLNSQKEIILYNEKLLEMTGLKTPDIIENPSVLLAQLPLKKEQNRVHKFVYTDSDENSSFFTCTMHPVAEAGLQFTMIRISYPREKEAAKGGSHIYEKIVNNLGDPVITVNIEGMLTAANPSFLKSLGFIEETLPEKITDIYSCADDFDKRKLLLIQQEKVNEVEAGLITSGGTVKQYIETLWAIKNSEGIIEGYTSHFRDLSRIENLKSQLKISEINYNRLFDIIASSIIIVDELGTIINVNSSAEKMYGVSRETLRGENFDKVFYRSGKRFTIPEIFKKASENYGRFVEIGIPRKRPDNQLIYTYSTYFLVNSGTEKFKAMFIMEKDLTARVRLEKKLQKTVEQIKETQRAAITGFAKLTEYRDHVTGDHLDRISQYTRLLCNELKKKPKYSDYIDDNYIDDLSLSSVLHDVGKVGIEDSILMKAGKLTGEEYQKIKKHTELGGSALSEIDKKLGYESFLTLGREVAYYHHEKWDGSGYPEGCCGENIPLSARIVGLADVYDALTSARPYKAAFDHDTAVKLIASEKGKHFDPDIVDIFMEIEDLFMQIKEGFDFSAQN